MKKIILAIFCIVTASNIYAVVNAHEALALAQKVNNYFMYVSEPDPTANSFVGGKTRLSNVWMRGTYYNGLMNLYEVDARQEYLDYTYKWGSFHEWRCHNDKYWDNITNADYQCCVKAYLDMYDIYGNDSMYVKAKVNFDNEVTMKRIDFWTWIDAIHMGMPAFFNMSNVTHDPIYRDMAFQYYMHTRNSEGGGLFNTETGLWWRDKNYTDKNIKSDVKKKEGFPCYWSRGDGWVFAALCHTMNYIADHTDAYYQQFLADYLLMAKALRDCQQPGGWWTASLLAPELYPNMEVTGTGLFLFGMAWGINNGVLPADEYKPVCDKAYEALAACVHDDGFIGFIQGAGSKPSDAQPVEFNSVPDFYDFGCGCWLVGVSEYIKLLRTYEIGLS